MDTPNFVPVPQEMWKAAFGQYDDRLHALNLVTPYVVEQMRVRPHALHFKPSPLVSVQARSLYVSEATLKSCIELIASVRTLWIFGHLLASAHCVRILFELWAKQIYICTEVLEKAKASDLEAKLADAKLQKLMLGSNSKIGAPTFASEENVVQIRRLNSFAKLADSNYAAEYDFLCDFSHPTLMHSHCHHVRLNFSWDCPGNNKLSHEILDRDVSCTERATDGVRVLVDKAFRECVPSIEAEKDSKAD